MIEADLDIRRSQGCGASAKDEAFAGSFEEVVVDLERPHRKRTYSTRDRLRVCAGAAHSAMKFVDIGILDGHVRSPAKFDAAPGFIRRRAMDVKPVHDDLVHRTTDDRGDKGDDWQSILCCASNLQSQQAIMVRAVGENERTTSR